MDVIIFSTITLLCFFLFVGGIEAVDRIKRLEAQLQAERELRKQRPEKLHKMTPDELFKEHLDRGRQLNEHEYKVKEKFDSHLIALPATALGLTITFIHQITGGHAQHKEIIGGSWLFLIFSLCLTLTSVFCSRFSFQRAREILDSAYYDQQGGNNEWSDRTKNLEITALFCLLIGLILLAVFTSNNLGSVQ